MNFIFYCPQFFYKPSPIHVIYISLFFIMRLLYFYQSMSEFTITAIENIKG